MSALLPPDQTRSDVYADLGAAMRPAMRLAVRQMRAGQRLDLKHWYYHVGKAAYWRSEAAKFFTKVARYPAYSAWDLETARDCARTARVHLDAAKSCRRLAGNYFSIGRAA